jgi:tRNA threonylcarbamoyladenosine biosynthesis protein TsaE
MTNHRNNATVAAFTACLTSRSVAETIALGRQIGTILRPGDVIALVGRLGAGKTHLSKGLALGLGVADSRSVNSPTFVLINEYEGRCPIHHIDAYRLTSADELSAIGFDEMLAGHCVILVEWADRVPAAMPQRTLWIEIETPDENTRLFLLRTDVTDLASRLRSAALTGV